MQIAQQQEITATYTTYHTLSKILEDKYSNAILAATYDSPKSAIEISVECKIPISTVYRRVQELHNAKFLKIIGGIDNSRRKYRLYKSKVKAIMIIPAGKQPEIEILDSEDVLSCLSCGSFNCIMYYDEKYNGMRSRCNKCGNNIPES